MKKKITPSFKFIIVIGASAGGLHALSALLKGLPPTFPAPVIVVRHISPDADARLLLNLLAEETTLRVETAVTGNALQPGHVYLPVPDSHLMVGEEGRLSVTKGAAENRSRPAIDPLFRSAARHFGVRVIGILLTGMLDDGTSGLRAIKECGGTCIIQDPDDAEFPEMPRSALGQLAPDYCLPVSEMGVLLTRLVGRKPKKAQAVPRHLLIESRIAERVTSDIRAVNELGEQVPLSCPGCGGVLWQVGTAPAELRYRCHVGHAYTAASLLAEQNQQIEETMWTALRMFEQQRNLLAALGASQKGNHAEATNERRAVLDTHIQRIRVILQAELPGPKKNDP
ncbi:chemotaxis protein CheB [Pedobacter yulinensis]|uniref:protein-glutamate methylesterase n=1 Tax=Pedobacter yulinensis TaxID=2126353 RepID=A0A2T3HK32_9SPHI|nr:chemotaxis protein CheB [Pedobacter yulinensis]PST82741.1 chemotaxis protein CheB [Pedobacter yulinensis]